MCFNGVICTLAAVCYCAILFSRFLSFRTSVNADSRHFYVRILCFFYNPSSLLTPVYAFNVLQNSRLGHQSLGLGLGLG